MRNQIRNIVVLVLSILAGVIFTAPRALAQEGAVTWLSSPHSTDWNANDSWTTNSAPTSADGAYFDQAVTTTANTTGDASVAKIEFTENAATFTITNHRNPITTDPYIFSFVNEGVINNSANNQTINNEGIMNFFNSSTAGNAGFTEVPTGLDETPVPTPEKITNVFYHNTNQGVMNFYNTSNAGTASIDNEAYLYFHNCSTALDADITNQGGLLTFSDYSKAGDAHITNMADGGTEFHDHSSAQCSTIDNDGYLWFLNRSTAAHSTINNTNYVRFADCASAGSAEINNAATGEVDFYNRSTAACSTIDNLGWTYLYDCSTLGDATVHNEVGGFLGLYDRSDAGSAFICNDGYAELADCASLSEACVINNGQLSLYDYSKAGCADIKNNAGGFVDFFDNSSAGYSSIRNKGTLTFHDDSSAKSSEICNFGAASFNDYSTASCSSISNFGTLDFNDHSTGGRSSIYNGLGSYYDPETESCVDVIGTLTFNDHSTAQRSSIYNNGVASFNDYADAGCSSISNSVTYAWNEPVTLDVNNKPVTDYELQTPDHTLAGYYSEASRGNLSFNDLSSAADSHICNTADVSFNDYATAGSACIDNSGNWVYTDSTYTFVPSPTPSAITPDSVGGYWLNNGDSYYTFSAGTVNFNDHSNGGEAYIANNGGILNFNDDSNANEACIRNSWDEDQSGLLTFNDNASAGWADVRNNAEAHFTGNSTAAHSSITNCEGWMTFEDNAVAGTAEISNSYYSGLDFNGNSSADHSSIENTYDSCLTFNDKATAGYSSIYNESYVAFNDNSTADHSNIYNDGGLFFGTPFDPSAFYPTDEGSNGTASAGNAQIYNDTYSYNEFGAGSTADHATITNYAGDFLFNNGLSLSDGLSGLTSLGEGGGLGFPGLFFTGGSTAGHALINNNGILAFLADSTAGDSTIYNNENSIAGFIFGANAGNSTIRNYGYLGFVDGLEAFGAPTVSENTTSAGNATVTTEKGAYTIFAGTAQGGTSRQIIKEGGILDVSLAFQTQEIVDESVEISGPGSVTVGSIEGAGDIYLGYSNLTTGSNNLDTTFSGDISENSLLYFSDGPTGGSLTKIGTGTLTLTGDNSYCGGTVLEDGAIAVGSDYALGYGDVTVNGGTLETTGGPRIIWVGGNISVADINSYSTYTQNAGGSLKLGLGGTEEGQSDNLVAGTVNLGGTLKIFNYNSYSPMITDEIPVIFAGEGGVHGRFSSWTNPDGQRWLPLYGDYGVILEAINPSFTNSGSSDNNKTIGAALDSQFEDPALYDLIKNIGTLPQDQLDQVLAQLNPGAIGSLFNSGFALTAGQEDLIHQRLMGFQGMGSHHNLSSASLFYGSEPMFAGAMSAAQEIVIAKRSKHKKVPAAASKASDAVASTASSSDSVESNQSNGGFYVEGVGNYAKVAGTASAPGYDMHVGGLVFGLDGRVFGDVTMGIMGGVNAAVNNGANSAKIDTTGGTLGLYGGWDKGAFFLNGMVSGTQNNYKTSRAGVGGTANGSTKGMQWAGELEMGMNWKAGNVQFGPYVSGNVTRVSIDAFSETGSAAPVNFDTQAMESVASEAGVQAEWTWAIGKDGGLSPSLGAAWEHQFQNDSQDKLVGGFGSSSTAFTLAGPAIGQDAAILSAGLDLAFTKHFGIFADYSAKVGASNLNSQNLGAGINIGF